MSRPAASLQARPQQRLRVQGVLAVGSLLVRGAGGCEPAERMEWLMGERQRLLRELRNGIRSPRELGCYEAMRAAVEESDRALRRILEDQSDVRGRRHRHSA